MRPLWLFPSQQMPFGLPGLSGESPLNPLNAQLWRPATALAEAASSELRRIRRGADAVLYPVNRITPAERRALSSVAAADAIGSAVIAVTARTLRVYHAPDDLIAANDGLARVLAMPGPGVGPLGAAAFAREVALGVGEPVLTTPTSYGVEDLQGEMMGVFSRSLADGGAQMAARPETKLAVELMDSAAPMLRLMVGHGLGAWVASQARSEAVLASATRRRLVSFGAAPPAVDDDLAVVGAADLYGWALSDAASELWETPLGVGHHMSLTLPGRLDVAAYVARQEREAPLLGAAAPPRPMRGGPVAAQMSD